jgi:hypothetical protein
MVNTLKHHTNHAQPCHVERSAATNVKHEATLQTSLNFRFVRLDYELRLKAWPRELRPLRCSFALLRITTTSFCFDTPTF